MDLPHNPTSPEKIYEEVSSDVTDLWNYIQKWDIPGLELELWWKKQCYGAWCTIGGFQDYTVIAIKKTVITASMYSKNLP